MTAVVLCDIRAIAQTSEESNLALDVQDVVALSVEVYDLERDNIAGRKFEALEYGAICALTYPLKSFVESVDRERLAHEARQVAETEFWADVRGR